MPSPRPLLALLVVAAVPSLAQKPAEPDRSQVRLQWGVAIPMRDGVKLNATAYLPASGKPAPCLFTLTPYISDTYHPRGVYFAASGFPFLIVDARGRGNSEGTFRPMIQESLDGHDIVEWLATQPYCSGKVSMWGGSYAGYNQWATAKARPPHLATIVPVASPHAGTDFPMSSGIFFSYDMQWLTYTSGRTPQVQLFADSRLWRSIWRRWFESGAPFRKLDTFAGVPSPTFQEWLSHPNPDPYWDSYNPSAEDYARVTMPVLTITGMYDGDQPGALAHYRGHLAALAPADRGRHFLIIGPWDHPGTRTPQAKVGGLTFGPASLLDLNELHRDWYRWTMLDGAKPAFLDAPVKYYVTGLEEWRSAASLDAVTGERRTLHLDSRGNPVDAFASGRLQPAVGSGAPDSYVHDPSDVSVAEREMRHAESSEEAPLLDQQDVLTGSNQLVYHSAPLDRPLTVAGQFALTLWLAIDRPDTDIAASVSEITAQGTSIPLGTAAIRARYREDPRTPRLITTRDALKYELTGFPFMARQLAAGSRLRLVVAPVHSMFAQRNCGTGGVVAEESCPKARPITVKLFHDRSRPSALSVPVAAGSTATTAR